MPMLTRVLGAAIALSLVSGCDKVFTLTPVELPIDAPLDSPPDAPTILACDTNPIILRPTFVYQQSWAEQFPAGSSRAATVADHAGPDDDASYIASQFDGQTDLYEHVPVASDLVVTSVSVWVRARIDATQPTLATQVGAAFTIDGLFEWDDVSMTEAWGNYSSLRYVNNPKTGVAWTAADVNRLVFGVRKAYVNHRVLVTQIWAEVACEP